MKPETEAEAMEQPAASAKSSAYSTRHRATSHAFRSSAQSALDNCSPRDETTHASYPDPNITDVEQPAMASSPLQQEKILRYVTGCMVADEASAFEAQAKVDEDLAAEITVARFMVGAFLPVRAHPTSDGE